jgi:hypothetical protein
VAKALRTLREQGQLATGRRTMTVLDLDGLRRRAGRLVNAPTTITATGHGGRSAGAAGPASSSGRSTWRCRWPGCGSCSPCRPPTSCGSTTRATSGWWPVAAALSAWLALTVDRAARHHGDARLLLVGLGFLAAALFFGLHALATPGVLLDHANGGFALATPAGLALSAVFGAAAALNMDGGVGRWALRAGPYLRYGLIGVAALWGVVSLTGLPPLADPGVGERGSVAVVVLVVLAVPLYLAAALRCFLLYRRRRSVVLLSVLTADVLLAEAMVAVALGANWHLTWWLWHVLMVMAFGYVGYSAYVTYRREGATRGLFDAVGTEATLRAVRVEYGSALEQLVAAVARQEAGELTPAEMSLITSGLAVRFGLSEGQTAGAGPRGRRPARRPRADRAARRARRHRPRVGGAAGRARPARAGRPPRRHRFRVRRGPHRAARQRQAVVPGRPRLGPAAARAAEPAAEVGAARPLRHRARADGLHARRQRAAPRGCWSCTGAAGSADATGR